ncbi:hypothetical protein [Ectobacillus ponti]|uniref:Uncharacterized protein n=1 Tax=Ectobacillus ponti TaxID=2961894 RepID=A0AA41X3K2_9BACI|nr:hypothetical protein [Ectobacillus ponti]MCP8968301.1 hypothetical protein [Ectobacillus ponti]
MGDWNEQAAPNNHMPASQYRYAKQQNHEFSEELSDGGERERMIQELRQTKKKR